jgi:hypothetical protein
MTKDQSEKLPHGLYRLFWKSGGTSLASVGSLYDGSSWFAATNWTSPTAGGIASTDWAKIDKVEPIA